MRSLILAVALTTLATSATADPAKSRADAAVKFLFEPMAPARSRVLRKIEPIDAFARCVIFVGGDMLSDGDCTITGHRDAPSFETASGFFGDLGEGDGRWNGEPAAHGSPRVFAAPRAHMSLLGLRRDGQCWVAQTATICINP